MTALRLTRWGLDLGGAESTLDEVFPLDRVAEVDARRRANEIRGRAVVVPGR